MGITYANIELISTDDLALYHRGYIREHEMKRVEVSALVETGSTMLGISPSIKEQLGLRTIEEQQAELADGSIITLEIVGPVDLRFENRSTTIRAMVLPSESDILLGAIPLQDLDVVVDPKEEKLMVNPKSPDRARKLLK